MKDKKQKKKETIIRYSILITFLILFSFFSIRHFILGGGIAASVDALCPFGGFETLYTFIISGGFIPRILISSLILSLGIILTVILFKRGFCGYICPFGTIQELLGKIKKNKYEPPKKFDKYAKYLKYIVLLAILIGTAITGTLIFRNYDPFVTFFHFGKGLFWDFSADELTQNLVAFSITIVVLTSAIFIKRSWCRYLCPLGATMSIFSRFGLSSIKRNNKCIDCKICDKECPVNVKVSKVNEIKDTECINCNQCVTKCPVDALSIETLGIKTSGWFYGLMVVAALLIVIGASMFVGIWNSVPNNDLIDNSGNINVNNIKGWMTLEDVSKATGISTDILISETILPLDTDTTIPLKEIRTTYNIEFETKNIREFITNYKENKEKNEATCPWGIKNDPSPGKCGLYEDSNNNNICDLSE